MGKTSERVRLMKKNFIRLHNDGYTIAEIANEFKISVYTIYPLLQDIADANGVTRESLLLRVHRPHHIEKERLSKLQEEVSPEQLLQDFVNMDESLKSILMTLDNIINYEKENSYVNN